MAVAPHLAHCIYADAGHRSHNQGTAAIETMMRYARKQQFNHLGRSDENTKSGVPIRKVLASGVNRAEPDAAIALWIDLIASVVLEEIVQMSGDSEELPYGKTDTTH